MFDPASDPVYPAESLPAGYGDAQQTEYAASETGSTEAEHETEQAQSNLHPFMRNEAEAGPTDDRDLIIVEQDEPLQHAPSNPPGRVRRQEYRRLFASLRQG